MTSGLDTLACSQNWQNLYYKIPENSRSPYFSPQYLHAYMRVENHEVKCFWAYQDEENFLIYPYLVKSISALGYDLGDDYFDISGAYGYNGPLGQVTDPKFLARFNQDLLDWIQHNRIIAEFVRYCPITDNRHFHNYTEQIGVLDNVYIDLTSGLDFIWDHSFEYRVRKTVRKGESYGLRTVFYCGQEITGEVLDQFYNIYRETMTRNAADEFYFFDLAFFSALVRNLGEMALLSLTFHEEIPVTAEFVLKNGKLSYGFLGGTLREYYDYKPNTFQRWELIKHLCYLGIEKYSIGGGATRGDSIYRFKKSFAKDCESTFYIGTKVHLPEVYDQLRSQWAAKFPVAAQKYSGRLQNYQTQL